MRGQRRLDRLAAQRVVESLVFSVGQRRGHALGGVQSRQRRGPVDARLDAVGEAVPAHLLQVGKLQVRPRLDAFGDEVAIVLRIVLELLLAVRPDDADHAVVEVDVVVRVHGPHVVDLVGERVALDQVDVVGVLQHHVGEQLQRELGELDRIPPQFLDLLTLLFVDPAADAAGQAPIGMDGPAAHHLDQVVPVAAHLEDLAGDFHAHLVDHAQDVPLGFRGRGADHKVRAAQGVEVGCMVRGKEDVVEQLAQLLGRRRRIDVEHAVQSLRGRHVMRLGANAADPGREVGHILDDAALAELLKSAQLGDLQVAVGHISLVVQKDVDLAVTFQPRDGIDGNAFHGSILQLVTSSVSCRRLIIFVLPRGHLPRVQAAWITPCALPVGSRLNAGRYSAVTRLARRR